MTVASIPSPSSGVVHAGPFTIHMYGLMLLLGIASCIALTGVRWRRRGGDWELVFRVAVWGVAFGVVGARLYHVITSYDELPDAWWGPFAVWRGGLGIWGGVLFGGLAGAFVIRRAGESVAEFANAVAPGILLAQGIGRWGNWWNQELFGGPTSLPWGLEIDPWRRPPGYLTTPTFHPTFLYEFLWDTSMVALMLWLDRRYRIRPPALFPLYVALYTFGRTFEELMRVDPSHHFLGMRINFFVSVVVFLVAATLFVRWQFLPREAARSSRVRRRR